MKTIGMMFLATFLSSAPSPSGPPATGHKAPKPVSSNTTASDISQPLRRYLELTHQAPHLFARPGNHRLGEIELILDPERIMQVEEKMRQKFVRKQAPEAALRASRAGVLMEDAFWIILREAVVFPDGHTGLFNRYVSTSSLDGQAAGSFGLPLTPKGTILLIREYRHQERAWRLGLPGGFRDAGEDEKTAVEREVAEEMACRVKACTYLGPVDADLEPIPLYVCRVDQAEQSKHLSENTEAIDGIVELTVAEAKKAVAAGSYVDLQNRKMFVHGPLAAALVMLEQLPHVASGLK